MQHGGSDDDCASRPQPEAATRRSSPSRAVTVLRTVQDVEASTLGSEAAWAKNL